MTVGIDHATESREEAPERLERRAPRIDDPHDVAEMTDRRSEIQGGRRRDVVRNGELSLAVERLGEPRQRPVGIPPGAFFQHLASLLRGALGYRYDPARRPPSRVTPSLVQGALPQPNTGSTLTQLPRQLPRRPGSSPLRPRVSVPAAPHPWCGRPHSTTPGTRLRGARLRGGGQREIPGLRRPDRPAGCPIRPLFR